MAPTYRPDLVIGIDFGMTQTGVAYCSHPFNNTKTFQQWGSMVSEVFNKVPSRIAYSVQDRRPKTWGFRCDFDDPNLEIQEYFKLYLDPDYRDDFNGVSSEDAQKFYRDYLARIHDHVVQFFAARIPNWSQQTVEWVVSVPTTWHNPGLIQRLQDLLKEAGFGRDGHKHFVHVTLTEAEAAAISVAADRMKRDDVLVICDAGGGTTDVNILKLMSSRGEPTRLKQLLKVEGKAVGSALIDIRVQQYLEGRLRHIANRLPASPAEVAERMMQGTFERFKCTFGANYDTLPQLLLDVPGLPAGTNYRSASVTNSKIGISRSILKSLFDEQADAMVRLLDEQIRVLGQTLPEESCTYLILSGGLGSSQYIRDKIKQHFAYARLENARGMQILLAETPQLAVVHGLVMDRAQQLTSGAAVVDQRCARISYGVVVERKYDPRVHKQQDVRHDPRDGNRWATNQIEWLIKVGDRVDDAGVSKHVRAKLQKSQLSKPWKAQFVMCTKARDSLPSSLSQGGVRNLCVISADLAKVDRKVKNKRWYNLGQKYELAEFDLRVIPGAADLRFELWNNGKKVTAQHDPVEVDWAAGARVEDEFKNFEVT